LFAKDLKRLILYYFMEQINLRQSVMEKIDLMLIKLHRLKRSEIQKNLVELKKVAWENTG